MAVGFYTRSVAVLSSLYGLLFGFLTLIFYFFVVIQDAGLGFAGISFTAVALIAIAGLFLQFLISPWIMDLMLRWVYDFNWISMEQLPPGMRDAILSTMQQYNFTIGKVGIIHDGMPNAFTYGRFRSGARIVFTQGLIDMLNEEEQIAVVQHEMGHIVNYDFLFMTLASAIPLLFYYMYRTSWNIAESMSKSSKGSNGESSANPGAIFFALAVIAFIIYQISHLIVLLLSRYREHSADVFSAHTTRNPAGLSTALVKIAYGLVSAENDTEARIKDDSTSESDKRKLRRQVSFSSRMGAMGLADVNTSKGLVMQAVAGGNEVNPETVAAAATWDLKTPWAKFIELSSTHPLTGKRLKALDDTAEELGIMRKYPDLGKLQPPESL